MSAWYGVKCRGSRAVEVKAVTTLLHGTPTRGGQACGGYEFGVVRRHLSAKLDRGVPPQHTALPSDHMPRAASKASRTQADRRLEGLEKRWRVHNCSDNRLETESILSVSLLALLA